MESDGIDNTPLDGVNTSDFLEEGQEDMESMDFGDFMQNIESSVMSLVKESAKAPETMMQHWDAFSSAIDWKENWIRGLLATHACLFTLVLLTRTNVDAQTILFLLICGMILCSERINSYCSTNWQSFSSQNYFDEHGVFASVMYAGPLLFICFVQLINFLLMASSSLIKVKRIELKAKLRAQKEAAANTVCDNARSSNGSESKASKGNRSE